MAWLEKHGGDPRMEQSPWNTFDDTLLLPDLPEVQNPGSNATDLRPFETSPWMKEIEARYLTNAPAKVVTRRPKAGVRKPVALAHR